MGKSDGRLLAIDASSVAFGLALSDQTRKSVSWAGDIRTPDGGLSKRLGILLRGLSRFLKDRPFIESPVFIECPFLPKSSSSDKTAIACISGFGVAVGICAAYGLSVRRVNPAQWHSIFFFGRSPGKGNEVKTAVRDGVRALLQNLKMDSSSSDAFDAAGLLWVGLQVPDLGVEM